MSIDQYAACPCGSGKKFKWCCQAIYPGIERAWDQERNGQHEMAMRTIDQVVAEHGNNPEAWGQKAHLLAVNGQTDLAEEALARAFALNPNYPFGLRLQAGMRHAEGEFMGALLLARKAAELYDPEAHDTLVELFLMIFDCEMRCNRPVAGRAALERVIHLMPAEQEFRDNFEQIFGDASRFPAAACKGYTFRFPEAATAGDRRKAWDAALGGVSTRFGAMAQAFDKLTQEDPADANAWHNLGLSRAWLGDNKGALAALDQFIDRTDDTAAAVEVATLCEVLRFGYGMDDTCDYQEFTATARITDTQPVGNMLNEWHSQRRLIVTPTEQEGVFMGLVIELTPTGIVTVGRPATESGRLAGYVVIVQNVLRLMGSVPETFDRLRDEVRQKLALGLDQLKPHRTAPQFHEILSEALSFPVAASSEEENLQSVLDHAARFYEETWIHRPRKSLKRIAPVDAASHPRLRLRLLGVIAMLEQCAVNGILFRYDFNRLRHKLGLDSTSAAAPALAASASGAGSDISAMDAPELAALQFETLPDEQLEKAYQAAYRLDAQELAGKFAAALIARPPQPGRTDLYPWVSFLIQKAMREGEFVPAIDHVNEGTRLDCERNEGKRRDDYEMWRAQVHTKQGDFEAARDVYHRLIERTPRNFKFRGKAAEAMLALKQPAKALEFAEQGAAAAKVAKDRDSEQYLLELAAAARKQV
jgi:tetratricopeptide (TPR) repeat protein